MRSACSKMRDGASRPRERARRPLIDCRLSWFFMAAKGPTWSLRRCAHARACRRPNEQPDAHCFTTSGVGRSFPVHSVTGSKSAQGGAAHGRRRCRHSLARRPRRVRCAAGASGGRGAASSSAGRGGVPKVRTPPSFLTPSRRGRCGAASPAPSTQPTVASAVLKPCRVASLPAGGPAVDQRRLAGARHQILRDLRGGGGEPCVRPSA